MKKVWEPNSKATVAPSRDSAFFDNTASLVKVEAKKGTLGECTSCKEEDGGKTVKDFRISHIAEKFKWSRLRADTHPRGSSMKTEYKREDRICGRKDSVPNALNEATRAVFVTAVGDRFEILSKLSSSPPTSRRMSDMSNTPGRPLQDERVQNIETKNNQKGDCDDAIEDSQNLKLVSQESDPGVTKGGLSSSSTSPEREVEPDNSGKLTSVSNLEIVDQASTEVMSSTTTTTESTQTSDWVSEAGNVSSVAKKRMNVIEELIKTEENYVRDLKEVVEGYMGIMREAGSDMPEDLREGRDKMVFGNIVQIYEWHRDVFIKALEKCMDHPQELGPLFKKYERKLLMYVVYCRNKPISEFIVADHIQTYFEEIRQRLGHALTLADFLIKPVQRILKYQLLLKDILKYTESMGIQEEIDGLKQACHVMEVVPKEANDMMNVGRLQGFEGKIAAQGKLIMFGPLIYAETNSAVNFKGKEMMFFFFEQSIIISEPVGKKTQFSNQRYIYKDRVQVNKMSLEESVDDGDGRKFMLKVTSSDKSVISYICQCSEKEMRDNWVENLRGVLQTQSNFVAALQSPIEYYQKALHGKDSQAPL